MDTQELLEHIRSGGSKADELLYDLDPEIIKDVEKALKLLRKSMIKIKNVYQDASYYVEEDNFLIVLGNTHDGHRSKSQQEVIAYESSELKCLISGGGW